MPRVSARLRCVIRSVSPAGVLARFCSSCIWPFGVGEDALDREPGWGERAFAAGVGGGVCLVRGEEGRFGAGELWVVGASSEALVGDHDLARGAGEQVGERLVLMLVGGHFQI